MTSLFETAPFTGHMAVHMLLVALVAPVAALAIAHSRFDPVRRAPAWFPALVAAMIEFAAVWAWHAPALHVAARHDLAMLLAERATFLAAALYLWLSILGGGREARRGRAAAGVIALVLTFAHMTMLGALIALTPRDLYGHGAGGLVDQQGGGALMIAAGTVAYLGAALWLSREMLAERAPSAGRA